MILAEVRIQGHHVASPSLVGYSFKLSRMVKELDLFESNHGCGLNALSKGTSETRRYTVLNWRYVSPLEAGTERGRFVCWLGGSRVHELLLWCARYRYWRISPNAGILLRCGVVGLPRRPAGGRTDLDLRAARKAECPRLK
jgi:hypothetical protein